MNLFYNSIINSDAKEIIFSKEESRHITKVLRKKEGDKLHITNGKGFFFTSEILSSNPKQCIAQILSAKKQDTLPYQLHMAVAPTKNNDRFEWFLEKATEIGIHTITPIFCDHSERKVIKPERFEKIIESAMKQSLKAYKPILAPAISFSEFIKITKEQNTHKFIAHCEEISKQLFKDVLISKTNSIILIGPEGDFSASEIELATKNNFTSISLGASRLRTETAALSACHTVSLLNQ